MSKNVIVKKALFIMLLVLGFFGCKIEVPAASSNDNGSGPNSSNNNESGGGNSYNSGILQVTNKTQYDVRVYLQSIKYSDPWLEIPAGRKDSSSLLVSNDEMGDPVYIEYIYNIGNIKVPYFDIYDPNCLKTCMIRKDEVFDITLPKISTFSTKESLLLVQNDSNEEIFLKEGAEFLSYGNNGDKNSSGSEANVRIKPNDYKAYAFSSIKNLDRLQIGTTVLNTCKLPFSKYEKAKIYTVRYTGEDVQLISISPLDADSQSKMWSIPLSQAKGKTLMAGKFGPRENAEDGYVFFGKQI
ncbi:MAG: hypothetical protein MJ188_02915, partial [Treponema sp.]|nr:hypothetical protein [Treponema sp.]